uniref:Alpha/beta hydrolase n=1 Tax=Eiseniibacteriota bacterium TaxID=2212470 RepID=A0A832I5S7_UNCEI
MIAGLVRLAGAIALIALALAAWWLWPSDGVAELRARHAPLVRVLRAPRPDLGPGVERWVMVTARGDTVRGLWRPAPGAGRWTAVLLGGIGTGDRAALLVPPGLGVSVLAIEWTWDGPRRLGALGLLANAGAIRDAALASPAALATGLEAAARAPGVDTARVALLGVSLGVPPALAALWLSSVPDAVALVHGAGDLAMPFARGLERAGVRPGLARAGGALAARLLRPLEPWRNARAARGVPVLLVNSDADELLPRPSIARLHAALPHATVRWEDGAHIRPQQRDRIARLSARVLDWLERLPR